MEFALIAPIFLLLILGLFQMTELVRTQLKVTHAADGLAKMVAQQPSPVTWGTSGIVGNLCTGASFDMTPLDTTKLAASVASVTTSSGTTSMDWETHSSCATKAVALDSGTAVSLATGYGLVPNSTDSVIVVKATYNYTPTLTYLLGVTVPITQYGYARPRSGTTIACSNC